MQKLVWQVKLVADSGDGAATEVEVARIEREAWADLATLGLSLDEGKRLTAAIQTEIVRAQALMMGERFRCCAQCGSTLSSKGYRQVTFRSLFGGVPLRVRRFESCRCRDALPEVPQSFSALTLQGGMAPELANVTAKFAALAPFGKVAEFLAELLPVGGAVNAGTARNRTRRVGERIARLRPAGAPDPEIDAVTPAGLDRPRRRVSAKPASSPGTQFRGDRRQLDAIRNGSVMTWKHITRMANSIPLAWKFPKFKDQNDAKIRRCESDATRCRSTLLQKSYEILRPFV